MSPIIINATITGHDIDFRRPPPLHRPYNLTADFFCYRQPIVPPAPAQRNLRVTLIVRCRSLIDFSCRLHSRRIPCQSQRIVQRTLQRAELFFPFWQRDQAQWSRSLCVRIPAPLRSSGLFVASKLRVHSSTTASVNDKQQPTWWQQLTSGGGGVGGIRNMKFDKFASATKVNVCISRAHFHHADRRQLFCSAQMCQVLHS